jgi:hypothetical protein
MPRVGQVSLVVDIAGTDMHAQTAPVCALAEVVVDDDLDGLFAYHSDVSVTMCPECIEPRAWRRQRSVASLLSDCKKGTAARHGFSV